VAGGERRAVELREPPYLAGGETPVAPVLEGLRPAGGCAASARATGERPDPVRARRGRAAVDRLLLPPRVHLGEVYKYKGTPVWAELESDRAQLMVSTDGDPIDPAGQGVLFYLYSSDLAAQREQLLGAGIDAGEIEDGTPGPRQQMQLTDPDGYVLMVAQTEPEDDQTPAGG